MADERRPTTRRRGPVCRRLMTVPESVPECLRIHRSADNITRFPDSHRVEAYLGSCRETLQLGMGQRLSITRRGATVIRWFASGQAAWAVRAARGEARPLPAFGPWK